jgi:hypothetical protein
MPSFPYIVIRNSFQDDFLIKQRSRGQNCRLWNQKLKWRSLQIFSKIKYNDHNMTIFNTTPKKKLVSMHLVGGIHSSCGSIQSHTFFSFFVLSVTSQVSLLYLFCNFLFWDSCLGCNTEREREHYLARATITHTRNNIDSSLGSFIFYTICTTKKTLQ